MDDTPSAPASLGSIAKAWQIGSDALILCISVPRNQITNGIKKLYLQLNLDQVAPAICRIGDKPEKAEPKGIFSDQIRKNLIGAHLRKIMQSDSQSLVIEVTARNGVWHLVLESSKPPMLWLIDPTSNVFAKMTRNQVFTKKYHLDRIDLTNTSTSKDISESILSANKVDTSTDQESPRSSTASAVSTSQRALLQQIRRRLRTARKSMKRLESEVRNLRDVEAAQLQALALKANFSLMQPGLSKIKVHYPEEDSPALDISIDPQKTPGENLELKFKSYKKTKGAFEHQQNFLASTQKYHDELLAAAGQLEMNVVDDSSLSAIANKLKISEKQKLRKTESGHAPEVLPYRLIKNAQGVEFRIGKGPKQNDELTKSMRGNDWWFHVVQGGGSHIVLSSRFASGGGLNPNIQRQAAILALHYSKARKACEGEVYMTQKQNLRKTKGLNPGLWLVDRSEILFVRYDAAELKAIIGSDENG